MKGFCQNSFLCLVFFTNSAILTTGGSISSKSAPGQQEIYGLEVGLSSGCECTYEYIPQCGTDGNTYINPCIFACESDPGVQIEHPGECEGGLVKSSIGGETCGCGGEHAPVCAASGQSYLNLCVLQCQGEEFAHDGFC